MDTWPTPTVLLPKLVGIPVLATPLAAGATERGKLKLENCLCCIPGLTEKSIAKIKNTSLQLNQFIFYLRFNVVTLARYKFFTQFNFYLLQARYSVCNKQQQLTHT
jgi:hypothetical protein